tara:strand:- start:792 stop:1052 length:261 start_codon:yes stop_codon:yes gene_type:complete
MVIITVDKATNIVFYGLILILISIPIVLVSILVLKLNKSKAEKFSYKKPDEAFKLNEKFKKPIPLKKATNIFNKNYEKQKSKIAKK